MPSCPPHIPDGSGEECTIGHNDESGSASCFRCATCKHWIRPHLANSPCPKCKEVELLDKRLCPKCEQPMVEEDEARGKVFKCKTCGVDYKPGSFLGFQYPTNYK